MATLNSSLATYTKTVEQVRQIIQPVATSLGLSETSHDTLATTMAYDSESAVNRKIAQSFVADIHKQKKKINERKKIYVGFYCHQEEQTKLSKVFYDYTLVFLNDSSRISHTLAGVARQIEFYILKYRVGDNVSIIDIGGAYKRHVMAGHMKVHSCSPPLSYRDHSRITEQELFLAAEWERCPGGRNSHMLKCFSRSDGVPCNDFRRREARALKYRCFKRAQECEVTGDIGISLHSGYDISMDDMMTIMKKKKLKRVYGSLMHCDSIRSQHSGEIPMLNVEYVRVLRDNVIRFFFRDDSSDVYTHRYDEYLKYLDSRDLMQDGVRYSYRIMERRENLIFFVFCVHENNFYEPLPKKRSYFVSKRDCVRVNTFRVNQLFADKMCPESFEPVEVCCPREIWDKAMKKIQNRSGMQWTRANLHSYFRQLNAAFIINGKSVMTSDKMTDDQFEPIVTAMIVIFFKERLLADLQTDAVLKQVMCKRRLFDTSWVTFSVLKLLFCKAVRCFVSPISDAIDNMFRAMTEMVVANKKFVSVIAEYNYEVVEIESSFAGLDPGEIRRFCSWTDDETNFPTQQEMCGMDRLMTDADVIESLGAYLSVIDHHSAQFVAHVKDEMLVQASVETPVEKLQESSDHRSNLASYAERVSQAVGEDMFVPFFLQPDFSDFDPGEVEKLTTSSFKCPDTFDIEDVTVPQWKAEIASIVEEGMRYNFYSAVAVRDRAMIMRNNTLLYGEPDRNACLADQGEKTSPNWMFFDDSFNCSGFLIETDKRYAVGMDAKNRLVRICYPRGREKFPYVKERVSRLFVYDEFQIFNGVELGDSMQKLLYDHDLTGLTQIPEVHMDAGIAGCGKTTTIMDVLQPLQLVISNCRSAADELREKVISAGKLTRDQAYLYIRTADSYLMNPNVTADVLYFDEVFMDHESKFWAVILYCGAKRIRGFGDEEQIPFINRFLKAVSTRFSMVRRVSRYTWNDTTWRCPGDGTMLLSLYFYKRQLFTYSAVRTSLDVQKIGSIQQLEVNPSWMYMVYFQDEKLKLKKLGIPSAMIKTVHEAEGNTFKHERVCLVRLEPRPHRLFDSKQHNVVAMSRHTKKLVYYTADDTDFISRIIRDVKSRTHEYVNYMKTPPVRGV